MKLYKALVKPVLTYNCGTRVLTKADEEKLNTFHRKQLRHIIGKQYPHKISNINLYKHCNEYPISLFVLRSRWKLFGHILKLDPTCPANKAMKYYLEQSNANGFRGRQRMTIARTINRDIERAISKVIDFQVKELKSIVKLEDARRSSRSGQRRMEKYRKMCVLSC